MMILATSQAPAIGLKEPDKAHVFAGMLELILSKQ